MTRRPLRLLHASDCHLGAHRSPGANEEAFAGLADSARRWSADAVLLAGDVFDHARVSEETLRFAAETLGRMERPTVILPGNHDAWGPDSPYRRFDFEAASPGVRVIREPDGELVGLPDLELWVWGRPVVDHEPSFRPLADPPPRPESGWAVAMGHGLVLEHEGPTDRGSPIFPSDLARLEWDYVALGHVGTFRLVRDGASPVCYAGPTAAHFGEPAGAVLVELVPDGEPKVTRLAFGT